MDHWPETPLNRAHFYDRRATALARKLHFDAAADCHIAAAQLLLDALPSAGNLKAKQSIQLQQEYHLRQKTFLKVKKLQYQVYKEALRVQQEVMSRVLKVRGAGKVGGSENEGVTLQRAIYRTIEEADSLLELLVHRDVSDLTGESLPAATSGAPAEVQSPSIPASGSKRPKDDNTVIEELRIVNYQLRSLITELMTQLSASEAEATSLRRRVAELEVENRRLKPDTISASPSAYSSPFVLSPGDEGLPEDELGDELPPLAMPDFDLSILHKKYQNSET